MGTNFYWKKVQPWFLENAKNPNVSPDDVENILLHIGKRSGAGLYCPKCGCSARRHGTQYVHQNVGSRSLDMLRADYANMDDEMKRVALEREMEHYFFKECPCCGTPFSHEKGAESTCSFTWTLKRHKSIIIDLIEEGNDEKVIRDEYDKEYTASEFFFGEFLVPCQIEFQSGSEFA